MTPFPNSRKRAKRGEQTFRDIANIAGAYAPVKTVFSLGKWNSNGDTNDAAGADYWPYAWGAAVPVEVKTVAVLKKKWDSVRFPIILPAAHISNKQIEHMLNFDGWLYVEVVLYAHEKSKRASHIMRYLAPYKTWLSLKGNDTGWRRPAFDALAEDGFVIYPHQIEDVHADQSPAIILFGEDVASRALAAAARTYAFTCEHAINIYGEMGYNTSACKAAVEICNTALALGMSSHTLDDALRVLANLGIKV